MEKKLKILFISRSIYPEHGGIEIHNYELSRWLSNIAELKLIANTHGNFFLPVFFPYAIVKAMLLLRYFDVVLLGDGVLGIIGWIVKFFHKKPVICIVHGLDLTYQMKIYQKLWVNIFIKISDKIIAVGNETIQIGVKKNIPTEKFVFIPNGVDPEKYFRSYSRSDLEKVIGEKLENRNTILTLGRLIRRKGVAWFVENVMPKLSSNLIYIVAGDGPDKNNIERIIKNRNLQKSVKVLGYVNDQTKGILFNTCDLFIQPNIKVKGDMEGFGIAVIEAASCHLPVIASKLEGLQDAIKDNQNGFLIEPYDVKGYIRKINELFENAEFRKGSGKKAREFVIENYSWSIIAQKYLEEIKKTIRK